MNDEKRSDAASTPGPEPRRLKLPHEDWRDAVREAVEGGRDEEGDEDEKDDE